MNQTDSDRDLGLHNVRECHQRDELAREKAEPLRRRIVFDKIGSQRCARQP